MHDGGWWSFVQAQRETRSPTGELGAGASAAWSRTALCRKIALMLALVLAITLLNLIPPLLTRNLIDYTLPQGDVVRLTLLALGMIAVAGLSGLLGVGQRYLAAIVGEGVLTNLRVALYGRAAYVAPFLHSHQDGRTHVAAE